MYIVHCSSDCGTRFTHANRHCPDHPTQPLVRDDANMPPPSLDAYASSPEATSWMHRYRMHNHSYITQLMMSASNQAQAVYLFTEKCRLVNLPFICS